MKAKTFDRKFDSGTRIADQLDLSKARRIGTDAKRVNVDYFPAWMVDSLDRETRRMGVTRQSLIIEAKCVSWALIRISTDFPPLPG